MRRTTALLALSLPAVLALGALAAWQRSEAARLGERARRLEAARMGSARDAADAAATAAERARRDAERIAFLEGELASALRQVETVNATLAARVAEFARLRDEQDAARRTAQRGMPSGVRAAIQTLHELLRQDGHDGLWVAFATAIEAAALRDVELIERAPDGLSTTFYRAAAMRLELDRALGVLALVLTDGVVLRDGTASDLPADGLRIELARVDGPTWEARLPFLVAASGAYPSDPEAAPSAPRLDPFTYAGWLERVGNVLAEAGTDVRWTLRRYRGLEDGNLRQALLLAFGAGQLLEQTAEAERLAIEVDVDAGIVSLLLRGGVLHRRGGDTTIPESGYRILLPGVTPSRAIELMLGMVERRTDGK